MTVFRMLIVLAGAAALSACHFAGHVPPGQAKKALNAGRQGR